MMKTKNRLGRSPLEAKQVAPDKCSLKNCGSPRLLPTPWCREHQGASASRTCDNLPALRR